MRPGFVIFLLASFATAASAQPDVLVVDKNTIISASNSFPGEYLHVIDGASPPTVVQLVDGGAVETLLVDDSSVVNVFGGAVTENLVARHSSTVNMLGGNVDALLSRFDSLTSVYGGEIGEIQLSGAQGTPTLNLFDGIVRGSINSIGPANINIHGGFVEQSVRGAPDGTFNITGGSIYNMAFYGDADIHWSGGVLRGNIVFLHDDAELHVYGLGLRFEEDILHHVFLHGTLLDGTVLDKRTFIDHDGNSRVYVHNVPEPSTLGLAALCLAASFALR